MDRFAYVFSLLGIFVIPSLCLFYFVSDQIVYEHLVILILSVTILGFIWDVWAAKHGASDTLWLWQFNKKNTIGVKIFDLPVEEILFYTFSSFYLIVLWEGIKFGHTTENYFLLFIFATAAIWSCLFLVLSFKLTGYNK